MFGQDEAWPPLEYEERSWHNAQDVYGSRTQKRRTAAPYLAAVPPRSFPVGQSPSMANCTH